MTRGLASVAVTAVVAVLVTAAAGPISVVLRVERVSVERLAQADPTGPPRVARVRFGARPRPEWDARPLGQGVPEIECEDGGAARQRRVRLIEPRVDEVRCPLDAAGRRSRGVLAGIDGGGAVRWRRQLVFRSGSHEIPLALVGATPDGLVVSSAEVWAAATGETLVPAPTHVVGPEARPVPDHTLAGAAVYLPATGQVLAFEADVTLTRRDGGLWRIDPTTGRRALLAPVEASAAGTFDRVEGMAALGSDLVLLARREAVRGPSSVSVAVVDRDGRVVFEERHGEGHACAEPQVSVGQGGDFAFAYRDDTDGQHVVVHYRIRR